MNRATDSRPCVAPVLTDGGTRPISLIRARRTCELYLCWHLALCVLLEWRARLDPVATFGFVLDLGGAALTVAERADLLQELRRELAEPEPLGTTAMLEAAGRWFCELRLPRDEEELRRRPVFASVGDPSGTDDESP